MKKASFLPVMLGLALAVCALGTLFAAKGWFAPLSEGIRLVLWPLRTVCNRIATTLRGL